MSLVLFGLCMVLFIFFWLFLWCLFKYPGNFIDSLIFGIIGGILSFIGGLIFLSSSAIIAQASIVLIGFFAGAYVGWLSRD